MSSECLSVVALDSDGRLAGFNLGEVKRLPLGITKSDVKHSRFWLHLYFWYYYDDLIGLIMMNCHLHYFHFLNSGRDIANTSPFFKNVTRFINELNDGIDFSSYLTPTRAELVRRRNPPEIILAEISMIGIFIYYLNKKFDI